MLGVVDTLRSAELPEVRVLNIYLPADYQAADTIKYPVIYLLDGSADEDVIHVAGLVQFAAFPWVKALPNSIVVGIANELQPFIARYYRASRACVLVGESQAVYNAFKW